VPETAVFRGGFNPKTRVILGVPVQVLGQNGSVFEIDKAVDSKAPLRIAFLNAHLATIASSTPALQQALGDFLILNDGIGVEIASMLLYRRRFPDNLNGTDFVPTFLDNTRHNLRLYLLGAQPRVVERAVKVFSDRWPRHRVVGYHHGFFQSSEEQKLASEILALSPDVVLVAMGNPRQEWWVWRHVPSACRCAIGVGALFDFLTGDAVRAPLWVRRLRLEWVHRLGYEPKRLWRRYLTGNVRFLVRVLSGLLKRGRSLH
jgi:exopolysaccharide biosynthesis WecB/TagA/CpsF family protein